MPFSNACKRQNPELSTSQESNPSQRVSKRRKCNHPSGSEPPDFWDNLSKIHLTKRALKELDRRNTETQKSRQPFPRFSGLVTRISIIHLNCYQPLTPAIPYLRHCSTRILKNIKQSSRHGGPDLSDLRGLPEPLSPPSKVMSLSSFSSRPNRSSTSTPRPSANTTKTKSIGPYDRNFQQNLVDGGVFPHAYQYPNGEIPLKPENWEEIKKRLEQPRPSLSSSRFSQEDHARFVQADANAFKEKQVTASVIPIIEGDIRDARCVSGGIPFANLDHLTDGTLVPGNPDIYYGSRPEELDRQVRDELNGHIVPSTQGNLPIAPNFFLAIKGPEGSPAVANRQACYDGALGARGMHTLQSYGQDGRVSGNSASTITSTYQLGRLMMFTSHPSQETGPESRMEYFMHLIAGWVMTSDPEAFRRGATAYRNARDWAKEQRDEAIRRANENICQVKAPDAEAKPISNRTSETAMD